MSSSKALAPGSLVLITGINGYVGGHVADLLLRSGYKVRGTARDQAKVDIATKAFAKYPGQFEGVLIKDITTHDAFAEIVKGVDGVVHVASDVSFGFDPTQVVTPIVNAMNNALTAANEEKSVKRFVYTSSIIAAVQMASPEGTYVNADSWNESAVDQAWVEPYTQENAVAVYAASKVEAERAAWKFLQEKKPHFVINSVLPGLVLGPNAFEGQNLATSGWIKGIYNGDEQAAQTLQSLPPIWTVDVRDIARLHVAALLEPDVVSQRILAVADSNNYGSLVAGLKQVDPSRTGYPAGPASEGFDKTVYDTALGAKLLQRSDRPGFTHTQETLRDQIAVAN